MGFFPETEIGSGEGGSGKTSPETSTQKEARLKGLRDSKQARRAGLTNFDVREAKRVIRATISDPFSEARLNYAISQARRIGDKGLESQLLQIARQKGFKTESQRQVEARAILEPVTTKGIEVRESVRGYKKAGTKLLESTATPLGPVRPTANKVSDLIPAFAVPEQFAFQGGQRTKSQREKDIDVGIEYIGPDTFKELQSGSKLTRVLSRKGVAIIGAEKRTGTTKASKIISDPTSGLTGGLSSKTKSATTTGEKFIQASGAVKRAEKIAKFTVENPVKAVGATVALSATGGLLALGGVPATVTSVGLLGVGAVTGGIEVYNTGKLSKGQQLVRSGGIATDIAVVGGLTQAGKTGVTKLINRLGDVPKELSLIATQRKTQKGVDQVIKGKIAGSDITLRGGDKATGGRTTTLKGTYENQAVKVVLQEVRTNVFGRSTGKTVVSTTISPKGGKPTLSSEVVEGTSKSILTSIERTIKSNRAGTETITKGRTKTPLDIIKKGLQEQTTSGTGKFIFKQEGGIPKAKDLFSTSTKTKAGTSVATTEFSIEKFTGNLKTYKAPSNLDKVKGSYEVVTTTKVNIRNIPKRDLALNTFDKAGNFLKKFKVTGKKGSFDIGTRDFGIGTGGTGSVRPTTFTTKGFRTKGLSRTRAIKGFDSGNLNRDVLLSIGKQVAGKAPKVSGGYIFRPFVIPSNTGGTKLDSGFEDIIKTVNTPKTTFTPTFQDKVNVGDLNLSPPIPKIGGGVGVGSGTGTGTTTRGGTQSPPRIVTPTPPFTPPRINIPNPFTPTGGIPAVPPTLPLGGSALSFNFKLAKLGGRQAKGLTPTLTSKIFNITGTKTKIGVLSGLGLRPLEPKKKTKRKKKKNTKQKRKKKKKR